jgi:GT2 family glycosyltransferase
MRYLRTQDINKSEPYSVEWISFASIIFRTELLRKVGFLDEDYFLYWVDADWCKKVKEYGYKIYCLPESQVVHVEQNKRGKKRRPRSIVDFHKGSYLFYRKHFAPSPFNPMAYVALLGLSIRALIHLFINIFRD